MDGEEAGGGANAGGPGGGKNGGCLNLGWGCLPLWAGLCLLVPAGLWF